MKKTTAAEAVQALKQHKLSLKAAQLADIMGTDSRAVATALRGPVKDGRVHWHFKKGVAWYRFVRQTAKAGGQP